METTHMFILSVQSNMAGRGGVYNGKWDKVIPPSKWEKLYNDMFTRAFSDQEKAGNGGAMKGVLWYQRESDTDTKSDADL